MFEALEPVLTPFVRKDGLVIDLDDHGVIGDNVADDTAALNALLATLAATTDLTAGANPVLAMRPRRRCRLTAPLAPPSSASHFTIRGAGKNTSTFGWDGGNVEMLKLVNPRNVVIEDVGFVGNTNPAQRPTYGVRLHRDNTLVGAPAPTGVELRRVFIGGAGVAPLVGIAVGYSATTDANNDLGTFDGVEILNAVTGYKFPNVNTLCHNIIGGSVASCTDAAFDTTPAATEGGAFHLHSVRTGGNAVIFKLGAATGLNTIDVFGLYSEGDAALVATPTQIPVGVQLNLRFFGGHAIMLDPGAGNTILFDSADAKSAIEMHGFMLGSPNGVKWRLPGAARAIVKGGHFVTAVIAYNGVVVLSDIAEDAGAPTFTNLGAGTLSLPKAYTRPVIGGVGGAMGAGALGSITPGGTDDAFELGIVVGAAPAAGTVAQINWGALRKRVPLTVTLTPASAAAAACGLPAITNNNTALLTFTVPVAPVAGSTCVWDVVVTS